MRGGVEGSLPTGLGRALLVASTTQGFQQIAQSSIPEELPGLVLLSAVVFPFEVASVQLDRPRSIRMVEAHPAENVVVACFYPAEGDLLPASSDHERAGRILPVGVACRLAHRMWMPNGTIHAVFQGIRRVSLAKVVHTDPYHRYRVAEVAEDEPSATEVAEEIRRCMELVDALVDSDPGYPPELVKLLRLNAAGPSRFADLLGVHLRLPVAEKRRIAACADVRKRLGLVEDALRDTIVRRRIQTKVTEEASARLEQRAREELLREELRAIRRELGEEDVDREVEALRGQVLSAELPTVARDAADESVRRLARLTPGSAEHLTVRRRLQWILSLPWNALGAKQPIDLLEARRVLDRDHVGLEDAKERILEVLATLSYGCATLGPVLCLVGPPGTGKTSLARAAAEACGRSFVRVSAAGLSRVTEVEGRSAHEPGAGPGLVLEGIRRAGTRDPVFAIDDVDKIALESGGAVPALVEATDCETNVAFVDAYLEIPFDLSHVLFLTTANVIVDVPRPLRDRLDPIALPGYTQVEKLRIGLAHLLPRALRATGFGADQVTFSDAAVHAVISGYSRESGVRALDRALARACRRLALWRTEGKPFPRVVEPQHVSDLLGPPPYPDSAPSREPAVGVVTGLAWTPEGGVLQPLEVIKMSGSGRIVVTGRLGDVMRESADIAYSWARANAPELGIDEKGLSDIDLHVHAPEGSIRKDGPSAGVALAAATVSVLTGRLIRADVAMTGELTLHGRVLDVGGIREKVSAAHRAGIHRVLIPATNRQDIDALPESLRTGMTFDFLQHVREYLAIALLPPPRPD
jgi:ATP-dependent Lon protease